MTDEKIVAAALEYGGVTFSASRPARHHTVLYSLPRQTAKTISGNERQGFLTSSGRFVDREEAWNIAEACGQLLDRSPTDHKGGTLYSEDVW